MKEAAETVIHQLLAKITAELHQAQNIAISAALCAEGGSTRAAVKLAMDLEDHASMANRMLSAIVLIHSELQGKDLD